ncbi:MAG: hypothetical protein SGPRY_009766 [Prymnesium sp.]
MSMALLAVGWSPLPPREGSRQLGLHSLADTLVPYASALSWQQSLHARRAAAAKESSGALGGDCVLMLQHPAVLTLGRRSSEEHIKQTAPFEIFRTERGGEDLHWYVGALEEVVIRTLGSLDIEAGRVAGRVGVWVEGAKVAAIGVRVSRWITMHGFALNVSEALAGEEGRQAAASHCSLMPQVSPDLSHFDHIVPCGISDAPVTSLQRLQRSGEVSSMEEVAAILTKHMADVFDVEMVTLTSSPDELGLACCTTASATSAGSCDRGTTHERGSTQIS